MNEMNQSKPLEEIDVKRGRRSLLALFAVALVPVLLAMVMYFADLGIPTGRTNNGELLDPPRALPVTEWQFLEAGREWELGPESGWKLLYVGTADCDSNCQNMVHHARQSQIALGRELNRVKRYYLSLGAPATEAVQSWARAEVPGLTFLRCPGDSQQCAVPEGLPAIYLADPLGNIILRYTAQDEPRALLDDLRRLLKVSRVG